MGKKDPIEIFKKWLIGKGILSQEEIVKINKDIEAEIEEAVKFAKESPYPDPEETLEDVYV